MVNKLQATSPFLASNSYSTSILLPTGYQIRVIKHRKTLVMLVYGKHYMHVYWIYNRRVCTLGAGLTHLLTTL